MRDHLFNAGDSDVDLGSRSAEAGVAFILDNDDCARIGNQEICAAHAYFRFEELFDARQFELSWFVSHLDDFFFDAQFFGEDIGDVVTGEVKRRGDDMGRSLVGELKNIFAQICFDGFELMFFQAFVEVNFFAGHGF